MKRIFGVFGLAAVFFALLFCLRTGAQAAAAEGELGAELHWALTEAGELTVSGAGAMPDLNDSSEAPWYACRAEIKAVTVEAGVTCVGARAFAGCPALESAVLGESVTSLGEAAFGGCAALRSVELPASLTKIGGKAFYNCALLAAVSLPAQLEGLGSQAFYGCQALTEIVVPSKITKLAQSVFSGCSALQSVTLPQGLRTVEPFAFYNCAALNGAALPQSVTSIGECAFALCVSLTNAALPEKNRLHIGDAAFYGCSALHSVRIPSNVEYLGSYVFADCKALESVTVCPGPDAVPTGSFAFCKALSQVVLPEGIETVYEAAFAGCKALERITLPQSLRSLRNGAFMETGLVEIDLPYGLQTAEANAFSGCEALNTVTVPDTVSVIGEKAFENCAALETLSLGASVEQIGSGAFAGCASLTELTLPNSLTVLGTGAFSGCAALSVLDLGGGLQALPQQAFSGCTSLKTAIIPSNVKEIGDHAFSGCSALEKVVFPESLESIGRFAFAGCASLSAVRLPEGPLSVGEQAFFGCTSLSYVRLPHTLRMAGFNVFSGSLSGAAVLLPPGVPFTVFAGSCVNEILPPRALSGELFTGALAGCSKLTVFAAPEGIAAVYPNVFENCASLASLYLPASVESIGANAFQGCSALRDLYFGGTAEQWAALRGYPQAPEGTVMHFEHEHTFVSETLTPASCGDGVSVLRCTVCGGAFGEAVPGTGEHAFGEPVFEIAPACGADGFTLYECAVCGEPNVAAAPATGHAWGEWTAADALYHVKTCENAPLHKRCEAHSFGEPTETGGSTCTEPGVRRTQCAVCGYTAEELLPPASHKLKYAQEEPAACTQPGRRACWVCTVCGSLFSDPSGKQPLSPQEAALPPTGHTIAYVAAEPATCTQPGRADFWKCAVCGGCFANAEGTIAFAGDTLPPLGHDWGAWGCADAQTHTRVCKNNAAHTETSPHVFDGGTVAVAPTPVSAGQIIYTCTLCGYENRQLLPPAQQSGSDTPIGASRLRESGGLLYVLPESSVAVLLAAAAPGAAVTLNGEAVPAHALAATGMLLQQNGKTLTVAVLGDADGNGRVTAADARYALRAAVLLEEPSEAQAAAVRLTGKTISAADARLILRAAVKLEQLTLG